jgi:hypothetical protein
MTTIIPSYYVGVPGHSEEFNLPGLTTPVIVHAGDGDDLIYGWGLICGEAGNDLIYAGGTIYADFGVDDATGGNDTIFAGGRADVVFGSGGQ